MAQGLTEDDFREQFKLYGKVIKVSLPRYADKRLKGYGFVQFETQESADQAIETVNGNLLLGKQVYVGPFVRRSEREKDGVKFTNVYVKNLGEEADEEKLSLLTQCLDKEIAQNGALPQDLTIIFVRHGYSLAAKQFTRVPAWEDLGEDLLTPAGKMKIKGKRGRIETNRFNKVDVHSKPACEGWLWKKGQWGTTWALRYCEMLPDSTFIYRVSDEAEGQQGKGRSKVLVEGGSSI